MKEDMKMSRMKQMVVQVCVLATVLVGFNVFASEFDPKTGELLAPEVLVVREDTAGNRVVLSVDKAPAQLEAADMARLASEAESSAVAVSPTEGGAEGSGPREFDKVTGTPAWYYWSYPRANYGHGYYNYYYSYGYYSYYPVNYYNYGYYRYYYYYRW
jgi:hypothetical protein